MAVRVRLVTHRGIIEYDAELLHDDGNHVIVEAEWAEATERDIGLVRFEFGDVWTEHYWRDRWYSVKRIKNSAGVLKGWYCDAARPAQLANGVLESVDLELDLWVSADFAVIERLDEDELEWVSSRDPVAARAAIDGIDELERQAIMGESPFR
jgi:predicted RNA-binding protein associated with RNAse of E/G family